MKRSFKIASIVFLAIFFTIKMSHTVNAKAYLRDHNGRVEKVELVLHQSTPYPVHMTFNQAAGLVNGRLSKAQVTTPFLWYRMWVFNGLYGRKGYWAYVNKEIVPVGNHPKSRLYNTQTTLGLNGLLLFLITGMSAFFIPRTFKYGNGWRIFFLSFVAVTVFSFFFWFDVAKITHVTVAEILMSNGAWVIAPYALCGAFGIFMGSLIGRLLNARSKRNESKYARFEVKQDELTPAPVVAPVAVVHIVEPVPEMPVVAEVPPVQAVVVEEPAVVLINEEVVTAPSVVAEPVVLIKDESAIVTANEQVTVPPVATESIVVTEENRPNITGLGLVPDPKAPQGPVKADS